MPQFAVGDPVRVAIGTRLHKAAVIEVNPATCIFGLDRSTYVVQLEQGKKATVSYQRIYAVTQ